MKSYAKTVVRTLGFACCWFTVTSAEAATPRAYVSVSGNDLNTCNVPATPCRTYTGAISQVTPGGTVVVMDSGTFGGGTISQAVTINAPAGVVALAATPIVVNPGSGNAVVLRGLTFQAPTPGTGTAIAQESGALFLENVVVDGWYDGVTASAAGEGLFVKGSIFRNGSNYGLYVFAGNTATVNVDDSFFERSYVGMMLLGGTGRVSNTVITGNSYGGYVQNAGVEFTFEHCKVSGNGYGFYANVIGTILRVSGSTITRNSNIGLYNQSSLALVESHGNNSIRGNGSNTAGTITVVPLQ
jgi:hypothetical protein